MSLSRRARLTPALLLLCAASLLVGGCSSDAGEAGCPVPTAAPAGDLGLLPDGLSLDGVGTVTRVVSSQGHVNVRAVSSKPIDEVTVAIQDAVTAAGFRPAGMDNEGFEAEVFFTAGSYAAGQALVRAADCDGQWDVDLVLVDPTALPGSAAPSPSGTPAPTATATPTPPPT
ncbi:hypothetical protein ACOCJ5_15345 [Knoellia sp. CPCC 206450]|uniref:hypothetical protein n=1 Tax=Knoellia tibetensis TaxID=3404798 RepID=UPI003B427910